MLHLRSVHAQIVYKCALRRKKKKRSKQNLPCSNDMHIGVLQKRVLMATTDFGKHQKIR